MRNAPWDQTASLEGARRLSRQARIEALTAYSVLAGMPLDAERIAVLEPEIAAFLAAGRELWEDGEPPKLATTPSNAAPFSQPRSHGRPTGDALASISLREAARMVADGEVSATEMTEQALAHADDAGQRLNCFTTLLEQAARDQARELDRLRAAGTLVGPLHGVPVTIKDNIVAAGAPLTAGSPVFAHLREARRITHDAESVQRLREAGAIILAKTTLYEFAFGEASTRFGATRNPWDLERSTGGSSSGSVASIAAGVGYASLATDTGGSIRVPSSFCGVVGLKPTKGRVSCAGVVPVSSTLDHVGPIARDADSVRIALRALTGSMSPGLAHPLNTMALGIPAIQPSERCAPEVRVAVESVARVLAERGVELVEVELPDLLTARTVLWIIASVEAAEHHRAWLTQFGEEYHPVVRGRLERARFLPAVSYVRARALRRALAQAVDTVLARVNAVLVPTAPTTAYALGARTAQIAGEEEDVSQLVTRYTPLFSLAGCPAVSFPCGMSADGLPIGAQLVAARGQDETVLTLVEAYQEATSWHQPRPPTLGPMKKE